jgi:predicted RND superfamily exporter protein
MNRLIKCHNHIRVLSALGTSLILAFVIFCGLQLSQLSTRYSIKQFYPKNHPIIELEHGIQKRFALSNTPTFLVVLHLTKSNWLEQENLSKLKSVTEDIAKSSHVSLATSLGNVEIAVNQGAELRVGTLSESVPPQDWKHALDHYPLLKPTLISEDLTSAMIAVEPKSIGTEELATVRALLEDKMKALPSGITSSVSGIPALQIELATKLQKEVGDFFAMSLIIFVLMFAAFYRGTSPVAFAAIGLVACNTVVIGLLAKIGVPFTVLLSTLPVIISIAFMSLTVHTLYLWADKLREAGASALDPVVRWRLSLSTIREIFLANLLGSATTAIGFAMLATAAIPAIRDFALVVAGSVFVTFFVAHALLIVGLAWVRPVQRSWLQSRAWWTVAITRKAMPVVIAIGVVAVLMTAAASKMTFSAPLFDDLPQHDEVRKSMNQIDSQFGGTVALDYVLDAKAAQAFNQPEILKNLRSAIEESRKIDGVGIVLGVSDFFPGEIPATEQGVAENYFLYSMSQKNPLRNFVDNDHQRVRVAIRLRDLSSEKVDVIRADLRSIFASHMPNASLTETGVAVTGHTVNREVARELVFGFWQSLVVIGLLLVVVFRSVRWALLACLPNLIPPAILAGALAITQTPVKPSVALIFSIALGLAFNNTVYLLTRLRRMQVEKNLAFLPLRRTLLEEGNPCLSESVLMFAGFLIFLASDFQLNQTLGAYMVLSIVAGALADLVFLPAILKLFPRIVLTYKPIAKIIEVEAMVESMTAKEKAAIAASIVLCMGITFGPNNAGAVKPAGASSEATTLLNEVRKNIESKTDEAKVVLKTTEPNGDVQSREIRMRSLRDGEGYRAMVRIDAPADIKGTSLLAEVKGGAQDQWLYLPSTKQVRRVVSGKKSAGVLGSELSPEDLNADALRNAKAVLTKKDASNAWIEVTPDHAASEYSKVVITVSLDRKVPKEMDYYVGNHLKKKVTFSDYKTVNGVQRAQKLNVENLDSKRSTEVALSDLKVNSSVSSDDLTVAALKRGH